MQEILTAVTYIVAWLACDKVIGIESGLIKLVISLAAAIGIYIFIAVKDHKAKGSGKDTK